MGLGQKESKLFYKQDELNKSFEPDIVTGAYGDRDANDEWAWAAAEMFVLTGKPSYIDETDFGLQQPLALPTWSQVRTLAYYTLLRPHFDVSVPTKLYDAMKANVQHFADDLMKDLEETTLPHRDGQVGQGLFLGQ